MTPDFRLPLVLVLMSVTADSTLAASPILPITPFNQARQIGSAFYGDPPDATHPWSVHDRNRPQPKVIETTGAVAIAPPSDAVVLFDGHDLSAWNLERPKPGKQWIVRDGCMECMPGAGALVTREPLADCQLHIEWAAPTETTKNGQGRGNSGIFLMGTTEIQVLDNYRNPSYPDGMAGAVYGVSPPLVNALRPPGEFNSYDIVFRRPLYRDGTEIDPGYFTVFCNGVLIQDHTPLEGGGGHKKRSQPKPFPEAAPLKLQDHGDVVRFRNIWYRPLPPRAAEGGTNGALDPTASARLRQDIAAAIREDSATLTNDPLVECQRLLESLVYSHDDPALEKARTLATAYVASVENLPREKREPHKHRTLELRNAFRYLEQHGRIEPDIPPKPRLEAIVEEMQWDPKKK